MEQTLAEFRKEKDEAFKNASWSPLTEKQKSTFDGLRYYPENQKLVFRDVLIQPVGAGGTVDIPTSAGDFEGYLRAGIIDLSISGEKHQLHVYKDIDGESYFLPIRDATSGSETYEDGRYVDIEVEKNTIPKLDFNYAYNPYCAYNHNWRCPITPEENSLPVKIEAGEKKFQ